MMIKASNERVSILPQVNCKRWLNQLVCMSFLVFLVGFVVLSCLKALHHMKKCLQASESTLMVCFLWEIKKRASLRPANLRVGQLCEIDCKWGNFWLNDNIYETHMRLVKMGQRSLAFLTQINSNSLLKWSNFGGAIA